MSGITAPTLQPLVLQRHSAPAVQNAPAAEPAPAAPAAPPNGAEGRDSAAFTALRQVLATVGHFQPAPPDPPWADPRPDLAADHDRWQALLEAAYRCDGQDPHGVFGALNGIRCCGARLEVMAVTKQALPSAGARRGWRLVRGDELTEAEYQRLRAAYLAPHTEALTRLLSAPPAARS